MDRDTVSAMKPKSNKEEVRAILGSLQFVAHFIPNYSELTKSLVNITCKET